MSLNYQLHKATEKKIEDLVDQKLDIKRREENLIKKVEQFQKDNTQLIEEQKHWADYKSKEKMIVFGDKKKLLQEHEQIKRLLKVITKERDELIKDKNKLKSKLDEVDSQSVVLRKNLSKQKDRIKLVDSKEKALETKERQLKEKSQKVEQDRVEIEKLLYSAKKKESEAEVLFNKAAKKNSEANGLKIELGIRAKGLDEREAIVNKNMREIKFRRQELDLAGRELQLKRELLSKAYSKADVDDLDIKVDQMLASEKK